MTGRARASVALIAAWTAAFVSLAAQAPAPAPVQGQPPGRVAPRTSVAAYLVVDLQSGRRLALRREDLIAKPVAPGSIAKIATLIAALESRVVEPGTTFVCRRAGTFDGETVTCSHPALGRPLTLAEALAHSCNFAFATMASRLRREDFDRALVSLGLPPSDADVPLPAAALGLRGIHATPEQLLTAFARAVGVSAPGLTGAGPVRVADATRRVLIDGARGAAEFGSAASLRAHGVSALAKTGTAPMPGGRYMGLVVALAPADRPTVGVVVVAPGGAGIDAAGVAADRLKEVLVRPATQKVEPIPEVQLRVGRTTASGRNRVDTMALEEYVARVVSAEAGPADGLEARKALAIVARTFALTNRDRHRADGFDLCDLTHCQVFRTRATSASRHAAEATRGQVLRYGQNLATVYYTASCGGQSERPAQVWRGAADVPYLPSRSEDTCRATTRWSSEIAAASLARALRAAGMKGQEIRNLWVRSRTAAGRAARVAVAGFEPPQIDGETFRLAVGRTLGWQWLKSTQFNITRTAAGYRFDGYGMGHGVGLCLMGAARSAAAGATADAILATYFPGTTVGAAVVPDPRVEITVPAGAERDRQEAADLARRWLKEYAAKLSISAPPAVSLVFHPTVESYLRATGQPWWTAAATQGSRADLLPPSVLRQRGIFERTVRHELAHLVISDRLRDRPLWVREAAAMYVSSEMAFTKEAVKPAVGPRSCPSDEEMKRFASPEAMRDAYDRASACYVEQLVGGKRWDEIR